MTLKFGDFGQVGAHSCVVVRVPEGCEVDDHLAVWYGEFNEDGVPKVRTVPAEYVLPLGRAPDIYH
jgi:hypothetical protein